MSFNAKYISYSQTGAFSKIVTDLLAGNPALESFYDHPATINGARASINNRKNHATNRALLVHELKEQYSGIACSDEVLENIEALLQENTFTVCTAHQPNIFTGHLYFIYKIVHAIKLAEDLQKELPGNKFVPVFYMGSEDADLDELGHIYLAGEKYEWHTKQTGAVGRMKVDRALIELLETISGQLNVYPFGEELLNSLRHCYQEGSTIEQATFKLVNELFAEYGLLVLLPDNAELKRSFIPVIERELKSSFSHKAVTETAADFPAAYKVQASGREINLFYLKDDSRERIEKQDAGFSIKETKFDNAAMQEELLQHPGRFSPNVILRPVFQEMILPNIAFIGGGGEIAYWLELKKVFEATGVPFPVLVLRNSFMILNKDQDALKEKLKIPTEELFRNDVELLNELVKRESGVQLDLEKEKEALADFYGQLKMITTRVDASLERHTAALQAQAIKKVDALEKKMLRAEKRKFEAQQRQLHKLKSQLFPSGSLQERVENFMPFYARWGNAFIKTVHQNSLGLEQEFCIITEG